MPKYSPINVCPGVFEESYFEVISKFRCNTNTALCTSLETAAGTGISGLSSSSYLQYCEVLHLKLLKQYYFLVSGVKIISALTSVPLDISFFGYFPNSSCHIIICFSTIYCLFNTLYTENNVILTADYYSMILM